MLHAMRKHRWITIVTLYSFFWSQLLFASDIVIDGNTATSVTVNGSVSDVTTGTVSGVNAYNSFSVFDVSTGNVVNLHLPAGSENLLNLVHDRASTVDGMLNAVKDGQIGGNVYFANPHGFVVGTSGVVNVGSLHVSTPTQAYMDSFFSSPGVVTAGADSSLLTHDVPINENGLISIQGKVNAVGDVHLDAGSIMQAGVVQSGATFVATAPDFSDVVNTSDIESGSTLSVTDGEIWILADGDVQHTGTTASKGGDITIEGRDITVGGGALITAQPDGGGAGGNVTIAASDAVGVADDPSDISASSSVTVAAATIRGHDIAITATANNTRDVDDGSVGTKLLGALGLIDGNAIEAGGLQAGVIEADATATVTIDAGADLAADHDITLNAEATSDAKIAITDVLGVLLPSSVAASYARTTATAGVEVRSGAALAAGNRIDVAAAASNNAEVTTLGLDKGSVLLSIAEVTTDSDALIEQGASISAHDVSIDATSTSSIETSAKPFTLIGSNGGAIALNLLNSTADATMAADATLGGDLQVSAASETVKNLAVAASKIKPGIVGMSDKLKKAFEATKKQPNLSSTFAMSESHHTANASIADNADIDADNVTVDAQTTDRHKLISTASSESDSFSVGSANAIGEFHNSANAWIGDNATVDAQHRLAVTAATTIPSPVDWSALNPFDSTFVDGVSELVSLLTATGSALADALFTSYANATSTADEGLGVAGTYTEINIDNDASAWIGKGAQVTTSLDPGAGTPSVLVQAVNELDTVHAAGNVSIDLPGLGNPLSGGANALGGVVNNINYDVDVRAFIADGASVDAANDVTVAAGSVENMVSVSVAGGKAEKFGLEGSVNLVNIENNVQAFVDDKAGINAGNDISISADDEVNDIVVSGGVLKGASVGLGFSWVDNAINSVVRAFFGDDASTADPGVAPAGTLVAGHDVAITADSTQNLDSWTLAAAGGSSGTGNAKSTVKGSAGFGASGDVSINTVTGETLAYIDDGVTVDADFVLDLSATNTAELAARSGSASLPSGAGSSGLAGSYSENTLENRVAAYINDATITRQPDGRYTVLRLNAESHGGISSFAVGGAGTGKVGVAGSVAVNNIGAAGAATETFISNSTIDQADIEMTATDDRGISSFAGALAVSGTAGIGPAVSINNTANRTSSYLDNTTVGMANSVDLNATTSNSIYATAASVGVGTTTFGGAGSVTVNTIGNTTEAYLLDSTISAALHDITLSALDMSTIQAIAGGGAFGSTVGIGVSGAYNDINNLIIARVDGSAVTTDGSLLVDASSVADILAIGVGIGASSGAAGIAGSLSINKLRNTVDAGIVNGSTVNADHNVGVTASNDNDLTVFAGTASGASGVGGGGAVIVNIIDNDTTAKIDGADVTADANGAGIAVHTGERDGTDTDLDATELVAGVSVDAYSREDVTSVNVNGSGGGTAGVAASTSVTTIKDTTTALVTGSRINQPQDPAYVDDASAAQQVRLSAYERVEFGGGSGNGAGGGTAGVGVGVDALVVQNITAAGIENGSLVHANRLIDARAAHRENILSVSVGGAGGGTAGVVGSGNGVRLESTTEARVLASDLISDDDINVQANEVAKLQQIAGGIAGGGAVGATGAVGVGIVRNTTRAYLGTDSTSNANGETRVQAAADETIDHYVISASGGGAGGVAANVSVKVANSTTEAFIADGVEVNQDGSYGSTAQDVIVDADSALTMLGATGGASGGGVVGGGAAIDLDFVKNTTTAYIGAGAKVAADRDVTVSADAFKDVDSYAVGGGGGGTAGVSAMVSVVNIGAALDADSRGEVAGNGSYADGQVSGDVTQGVDGNDSFAASAASEAAADNNGTTVGGTVGDTSTVAQDRSVAYIGDLAVIDAGGGVQVASHDKTDVDQYVGGLAVSAGGSVGGSVGIVNTNTFSQAWIGNGATVSAGGDVDIISEAVSLVDSYAFAGAGGLVGLGAAVSIINDAGVSQAELRDGASIDGAAAVTVMADGTSDLASFAFGATIGAGAVGASIAHSNADTVTRALVGDSVAIGQDPARGVGSLAVLASSDVDADSRAIGGAAGLVSGSVNESQSNIDSITDAGIGAGTGVAVSGAIDVDAAAVTQGHAETDGLSVGAGAVGISIATAESTPEVNAWVGAGSTLDAGADIDVHAAHNRGNGALQMSARAIGISGGVAGVSGSDARSKITSDVETDIFTGAALHAGGAVDIGAASVASADADSLGVAIGGVAAGLTYSEALVDNGTDVSTAADVIIDAATIRVGATSDLLADAYSHGVNGGLLSGGGTSARARIDNVTSVGIGANNNFDAAGDILVEAVTLLDARSNAEIEAGGAITINEVSGDTDIVNSTFVGIGDDTTLSGDNVSVLARVDRLHGYARAYSKTIAVGSDSRAYSYVDVDSDAGVTIHPGAELRGQSSVNVTARTSGIDIDSIADAKISAGLTGNLLANAHGDLDVDSDVDIQAGSIITAPDIVLVAETVSDNGDFNRSSSANANTVVNWVLTKTTELVKTVSKIPIIGWIVKWVYKTVYKWVAHVLQSDVSATTSGGNPVTGNSIRMDGTLAQLTALSPQLTVNADGSIDSDGNINASVVNGEVVVNGVNNNVVGTIDIRSPGGTVYGDGTLLLNKTFDSVDIVNNSDLDMRINNIDVLAANVADPELSIDADLDLTNFTVVSDVDVSDVNITGNTAADIIVAGAIANPAGITRISNLGGDIYGGGLIESSKISLFTGVGDIGQSGALVRLNLIRDFGNAELTVIAGGSAWLDVQLAEYLGSVPAGHVINGLDFLAMTAGNDLVLNLRSGIVYDLPEDPDAAPVPVAVLANYQAGSMTAGGDLAITEQQLADFTYDQLTSDNGSIALDLRNGDAVLTRLSAINGGVSVQSAGAILNGNAGSAANVTASDVQLVANGAVGTDTMALEIDQQAGGRVDVAANDDVWLASHSGGLHVGLIHTPGNNVALQVSGDLTNANTDGSENIIAESVRVDAGGAVGTAGKRLVIDSGDSGAANAGVAAGTGIYLEERSGDLHSDSLASVAGNIDVLVAGNGDFGTVSAPGSVSLVVNGSSLHVATIDPASVYLAANAPGSAIDAGTILVGDSLYARAADVAIDQVTHTGAAGSVLDMTVDGNLAATALDSAQGGVGLDVSGNAVLGNLAAAGDVDVYAGGNLQATAIVSATGTATIASAGNMQLGSAASDGQLTVTAGGSLDAGDLASDTGGVDVDAGGDAMLGSVTAAGAVSIDTLGALAVTTVSSAGGPLHIGTGGDAALGTATAYGPVTANIGGDLLATRIASDSADVDLAIAGNGAIGTLAAAGTAGVNAGGTMLAIGSVDARNLDFGVAGEGGSLVVGDAAATDNVTLNADDIRVDRLVDADDGLLTLAVTGNDGGIADYITMTIDTLGDILFTTFRAMYSDVRALAGLVRFDELIVGEQMVLETDNVIVTLDYKDSKDNENSLILETRDQPIALTVEDTKVTAEDSENLFIFKEKL